MEYHPAQKGTVLSDGSLQIDQPDLQMSSSYPYTVFASLDFPENIPGINRGA